MDAQSAQLGSDELKLLQELRSNSLPGYALLSKTRLAIPDLIVAVNRLRERMLLRVTGEVTPDAINDSVFSVPIDVIGDVDVLLGNLRPAGTERFVRR